MLDNLPKDGSLAENLFKNAGVLVTPSTGVKPITQEEVQFSGLGEKKDPNAFAAPPEQPRREPSPTAIDPLTGILPITDNERASSGLVRDPNAFAAPPQPERKVEQPPTTPPEQLPA